jgi:hypothetical protein
MPRGPYFRIAIVATLLFGARTFAAQPASAQDAIQDARANSSRTYLGFDVNEYPGDAALAALKQTFAFAGYWLNVPPGATTNNWKGKRAAFFKNGFGFVVLFNGRLDRELKSESNASALGATDAAAAIAAARQEEFPAATIIFLDQEEGGRLLPEQMSYVLAWVDALTASGFRAGIYCSGMPSREGKSTIITANDIHGHEAQRKISYFVYNDACPPSPGCAYPQNPPSPANSGVPFAAIWQFAQSPRRRAFTRSCSASYNSDRNCYPPVNAATGISKRNAGIYLDLDSATSPDPSSGR